MDKLFTVDNISKVGIIGLLLIILVTGSTGTWVWGTTYNEVKAERDEWKKTALDGLRVAREISPARIPIMAGPPGKELTPSDIRNQLQVVKNINEND